MIPYTFVFKTQFPSKKLSTLLLPSHTLLCHSEDTAKVTLLDTFDQELQASGKILLQKDDELLLLDITSGRVISQRGSAEMLCTPEIAIGNVKKELVSISKLRAFLPIANLAFHSTTRMMLDDEGKTVARLHNFVFTKKKKTAQIVVSQPLRGYNEEYETLVKAVQAICTSKTTLNEALGIKTASYCAKPYISLDPHAPIFDTTRSIITTFIDVARQNEKGIQQDYDTEFLHDYRVSFRKVRSVISLFKGLYTPEITQQLKDDFAGIMQITGRLRDLDVYLLDKSYYYSLVPSTTHHGLNLMFSLFEKERAKVHKNICSSIKSKRYKKQIQALRESFALNTFEQGPLATEESLEFACKTILKRYNKVCKIARGIDKNTEDEIVHELRIHCKKLRYLMEFFTPLFHRNKIKTLIKSLKVLQDNLGRFNDYSVQQESLSVFLAEHPLKGTDRIKVAESIGALTAMLNMLQQKERNLVMENFVKFDNRDTRMLFDNLFSIKG